MERRTDNKMHRYFLIFVFDESLDPTSLRILVFHLADFARVVLINASSPSKG